MLTFSRQPTNTTATSPVYDMVLLPSQKKAHLIDSRQNLMLRNRLFNQLSYDNHLFQPVEIANHWYQVWEVKSDT